MVQNFYDNLAEDYHLIFENWREAVHYNGETLHKMIQSLHPQANTLYDCSCGIGTQAIGLALRGYTVHATDLSPIAVERAEQEAKSFDVEMTFGIADFRTLDSDVDGNFDVIISCDNSLPHLTEDDDIQKAVGNMYKKLNPDGLALISIRDYDVILQEQPQSTPMRVFNNKEGKRITFQIWEWEPPLYTVNHFILVEQDGEWETRHRSTIYRALQSNELSDFLAKAGFTDIQWDMDIYYQPIVTARKAS